jgi:hypothetical protein
MKNPIESAHEHLDAFMSQDVAKLRQTTLFPFIHIQPDGEVLSFVSAEELAAFGNQPFSTEISDCKILDSGEDSVILSVIAQRSDLQGTPTVRVKAIWGAVRNKNGWGVRWRHFLGEI